MREQLPPIVSSGGVVLLYPPITDPTSAYHPLVYVGSAAKAQGVRNLEIIDTNIEALAFAADPDVLVQLQDGWASRLRKLASQQFLTGPEQLEYRYLVPAVELDPDSVRWAVATLRSPEDFYDYPRYRRGVEVMGAWLRALSCDGFPGQFGNDFVLSMRNLFNAFGLRDLTDASLLDRLARPLDPYFSSVLWPKLQTQQPDVIGVSVSYTAQLPFAVWLLRKLRELLPEAYLVCGGTSVSNSWKNVDRLEHFGAIFGTADACIVGDGETAFVRLLEARASRRVPKGLPNTVLLDRRSGAVTPPTDISYEDLDALPTLDYGLMSYDQYFSPHPLVYYSPSRGCYWNKCTFCDYGLNFGSPTSPWRQRSVERCMEDLRALSAMTPYVYLAVDVLAPSSLVRLCKAVVEERIDIRWAAEVRLERAFDAEACRLLKESGCVCVSVGFESGSQRVLDAMAKGIRLDSVASTIAHFSDAGIRVQMMGFTDFPTETFEEAMATFEFLQSHRNHWSTCGIGRFGLTPGAIVATRPEAFDLDYCGPLDGDAIRFVWVFDERGGPRKSRSERQQIQRARESVRRTDFARPFAGGIDAAHSIFYYDRHGSGFPGAVRRDADPSQPWKTLVPNGRVVTVGSFDPLQALGARRLEEIHERIRGRYRRRPDHLELLEALDQAPHLSRLADAKRLFLREDGTLVSCSEDVMTILEQLGSGGSTQSALLAQASSDALRRRYGAALQMMFHCRLLRARSEPRIEAAVGIANPKNEAVSPLSVRGGTSRRG